MRKEASFPVRKMSLGGQSVPSDMLSEKDYRDYELQLQPQMDRASVYSYESRYTQATTKSGYAKSNRTSRTSYYDSRASRNSYYDSRASRASSSRRPPSLGAASAFSVPPPSDLIAPQAVYSNGLLGPQDMFGLPSQFSSGSPYPSPLPQQPRTSPLPPQTDYFGAVPSNSALLSVNSAYAGHSSATSPPPAASRSSIVRKSVGSAVNVPSPLGRVTSLTEDREAGKRPQGQARRRSRAVSFVDESVVSSRHSVHSMRSVHSNYSSHSRSHSSPPRNPNRPGSIQSLALPPIGRSSLQLPPGAREAHELMPPMPSLYSRAMASGHDKTGTVPFPAPRVSWNGDSYSNGAPPFAPPPIPLPSASPPYYPSSPRQQNQQMYQLPDGAYPLNHPIALAHQKLSSASTTSLVSPPPTFPAQFPKVSPYPTTPPGLSPPISPPVVVANSRAPTSPGYPSRFSRSPSASLQATTPGDNRDQAAYDFSPSNGYANAQSAALGSSAAPSAEGRQEDMNSSESSGSTENTSSSSSPPSSTPPTSHYGTAPNSPTRPTALVVKGKRAKHAKNSSSSSSARSHPSSSNGHSSSSHHSRKRGLWFDSIDETPRPPQSQQLQAEPTQQQPGIMS